MATAQQRVVRFKPKPGEVIELMGEKYWVEPHPSAPTRPFSAEGAKAHVYQLKNARGELFAFKVFKQKFRTPDLVDSCNSLAKFMAYEGMRAARRQIIDSTQPAVRKYPDLEHAMLMAWIHGVTWTDVLMTASSNGAPYTIDVASRLAFRFLTVMAGLEKGGIAHTDIAPGNVMVDTQAIDAQLLDLEDLYMPGSMRPRVESLGQKGYRHPAADASIPETTWCSQGDRYAAAILAAEILILANAKLARFATDTGFFCDNRTTQYGRDRFNDAMPWLRSVAPAFAQAFERSWISPTLRDCAPLSELRDTLVAPAVASPVTAEPPFKWKVRATGPAAVGAAPGSAQTPAPFVWVRKGAATAAPGAGGAPRAVVTAPPAGASAGVTGGPAGAGFKWVKGPGAPPPQPAPAPPPPDVGARPRLLFVAISVAVIILIIILLTSGGF